jgi:hypothetical protein
MNTSLHSTQSTQRGVAATKEVHNIGVCTFSATCGEVHYKDSNQQILTDSSDCAAVTAPADPRC